MVLKRGATPVVWKWFGPKRSDVQQTMVYETIRIKRGKTQQYNMHHLEKKCLAEYMGSGHEYFLVFCPIVKNIIIAAIP